ncbi:MAG: DUF4173 domain-containing protein [Clostridiales bacterium]|nr:DUF4173 domain-containing protein [Clostridiales bacterium]
MNKYVRALAATFIGTIAVVELFLLGDGNVALNATIMFYLLLIGFFIAVGLPRKGEKNRGLQFFLIGSILAISSVFTLFDNRGLRFLNVTVLVFLMGTLFLQRIGGDRCVIGEKGFTKELFLGYVIRPFVCLAEPIKEAREQIVKNKAESASENGSTEIDSTRNKRMTGQKKSRLGLSIIAQIAIALIIGIPLVLFLAVMLASSDAVFSDRIESCFRWLDSAFLWDIILRVFWFVLVVPFAASVVFSYKNKWLFDRRTADRPEQKSVLIPEASAITVLVLVNALYLFFAGIQSIYLFGAWAGRLPEGLTYAEYARSGFFELAFVSAINVIMILVFIRYTNRRKKAGIAVRALSIALIVLSGIQLASAFRRMALYIEAYGLSEDRFLVSAFMILMVVMFALLGVREFVAKLPLLKCSMVSGVIALLLVNFCVPGYWVASHNVDRYLSGSLQTLDTDYLMKNSSDSLLVLLDREEEIREVNSERINEDMDQVHEYVARRYCGESVTGSADPYFSSFGHYSYQGEIESSWKSFNVPSYQVLIYENIE